MTETRKEVLESAVQLERDGRKMYLELAGKASNELASQMYVSLAEDEMKHIKWIGQVVDGNSPEMTDVGETYERLRGIFADAPQSFKDRATASEDDSDSLELALEMENKSAEAYEKWAQESEAAEVKALCERLAQFERGHRQILEDTLEYLNKTGDWFMEQERWIFDGA